MAVFVPNGLLGSTHFQPNGLLGSTFSSPPASQQPPPPDDDLAELPPVSEAFAFQLTTEPLVPPPPPPQRKSHIKATTFDGKTVLIKKRLVLPKPKTTLNNTRVDNLLDVPIHRLLDQLSADTAQRLHDESVSQTQRANNASHNDLDTGTLWVDKYRPQRFTELMGNERAARETMAWVKQWDWCVFGKNKGKRRFKSSSLDDGGSKDEEDEYHRPKQRVRCVL